MDKPGDPARDGPDPSGLFCVRADPFRAQTCAGFGPRRTANGRFERPRRGRVAGGHLPPTRQHKCARAGGPTCHPHSNGSTSFLNGTRGPVVVLIPTPAPLCPLESRHAQTLATPRPRARPPAAAMGLWNRKGKHDREAGSSSGGRRGSVKKEEPASPPRSSRRAPASPPHSSRRAPAPAPFTIAPRPAGERDR